MVIKQLLPIGLDLLLRVELSSYLYGLFSEMAGNQVKLPIANAFFSFE